MEPKRPSASLHAARARKVSLSGAGSWRGAVMRGQTPGLAAVAVLSLILGFPATIGGQGATDDRGGLVGSWRVLSYEVEFQDGSPSTHPPGPKPNGYLVFG